MVAVLLGILAIMAPNSVVVDADVQPQVDEELMQLAITTCASEGKPEVIARVLGPDGVWHTVGGNVTILTDQGPTPQMMITQKDVWIGVRITAVPAPLAAHIGEDGVMIANVFEGSPAEEAGLHQYDVIVGLNGTEIAEPRDLTEAIGELEAGQTATLSIIRRAKLRELDIVPSAPPHTPIEITMKYEEPADSFFDAGMKLSGKALKIGPDGHCILEDLGELDNLPDMLKDLEDLHGIDLNFGFNMDMDDDHAFRFKPGDEEDMKILSRMKIGPSFIWRDGDEEREPEHTGMTIEVWLQEDGERLIIHAEGDKPIRVTRIDENGTETTNTYNNLEELKEADPEAFEIYEPHRPERQSSVIFQTRPFGDRAAKLRQQFQIDVHEKLKEAMEQLEKTRDGALQQNEEALKHHNDAMKDAHEAIKKALAHSKGSVSKLHAFSDARSDGNNVEMRQTMLSVQIDGSGKITVKTQEDGEFTEHEFPSKEAFQAAEPELYEQVKELLE